MCGAHIYLGELFSSPGFIHIVGQGVNESTPQALERYGPREVACFPLVGHWCHLPFTSAEVIDIVQHALPCLAGVW